MTVQQSLFSAHRRWLLGVLLGSLAAPPVVALAELPGPATVTSLRGQYAVLLAELSTSAFMKPLVVRSDEKQGRVQGEVFAVMEFPFARVKKAIDSPEHWCDIMILHINTKYCKAQSDTAGTQITVHIGKKTPEKLIYTKPMVLDFEVRTAEPDYVNVALSALVGPAGTSHFEIVLEVVALPGNRSFLHLSYAYKANVIGKLAMEAYLATAGRNKVGFSVVQRQPDGPPVFTGGVRGVVERNTMRYYLAISSYLAAEALPEREQQEARLLGWITATERYPDQLLEMDRAAYLVMKRAEVLRQQTTH